MIPYCLGILLNQYRLNMSLQSSIKQSVTVIPIENESKAVQELTKALTLPGIKTKKKVQEKFHYKYFLNYLFLDPAGLNAKTIVIEHDYTSMPYLDDYINYYAHCYFPYEKQCRRIHFFNTQFDSEKFVQAILGNQNGDIWDGYLGYIVIKPLPKGIIGSTVLEPYKKPKEGRRFTAIRTYPINLFGKKLWIRTLMYQEQDGIVGSCASSALWFAFQKTSELFQSKLPSPSDITISAGYDTYQTGKDFPSKGLELSQICKAIYEAELISEMRISQEFVSKNKWLKSFIYAYSKMGIPILMGIEFENKDLHLVTITGYRFGNPEKNSANNSPKLSSDITLDLVSENITKLYAHDDQTGPFSRLVFQERNEYQFKTSCWKDIASDEILLAKTISVIVPLKNTIRVTFDDILYETINYEFFFSKRLGLNFKWDIFLIESNAYKIKIRDELNKNIQDYEITAGAIMFQSLPKYIWVAQANIFVGNSSYLFFDLIYDPIDLNFENAPFYSNIYNKEFKEWVEKTEIYKETNLFKHAFDGEKEYDDAFFQMLKTDMTILNEIESLDTKAEDSKTSEVKTNVEKDWYHFLKLSEEQQERAKRKSTGEFGEDLGKIL